MRKIVISLVALGLLASCSPVTIRKEITEYKYQGDKLVETYTEALVQTPEKTMPIHLKHQELYE